MSSCRTFARVISHPLRQGRRAADRGPSTTRSPPRQRAGRAHRSVPPRSAWCAGGSPFRPPRSRSPGGASRRRVPLPGEALAARPRRAGLPCPHRASIFRRRRQVTPGTYQPLQASSARSARGLQGRFRRRRRPLSMDDAQNTPEPSVCVSRVGLSVVGVGCGGVWLSDAEVGEHVRSARSQAERFQPQLPTRRERPT